LTVEGSEKIPAATQRRKGGNRDSKGWHGTSGNNSIPPAVLYKGKYRKEVFREAVSTGSTFCMTSKEYITTEVFCKLRIISVIIDYLEGHFAFSTYIELGSDPLFLFE
jgi:hypothetical protein